MTFRERLRRLKFRLLSMAETGRFAQSTFRPSSKSFRPNLNSVRPKFKIVSFTLICNVFTNYAPVKVNPDPPPPHPNPGICGTSLGLFHHIREFTKPRRRRQRERHQTKGLMSRTMAVHVRFESWYISLPSSANQQREMTKFCVVWRMWTTTTKF